RTPSNRSAEGRLRREGAEPLPRRYARSATGGAACCRTSRVARRRAVLAAISSTAWLKASAFLAAGARKPLIFLTYWRAAARMSSSVTASAYGGRRVLIERHIGAAYVLGRHT